MIPSLVVFALDVFSLPRHGRRRSRTLGFTIVIAALNVSLLLGSSLLAQPSDLAERGQQANRLMAAGKFAEAAEIYAELVRAAPNNPGLLSNLGMAYHLAGKPQRAIPHLEAAVKLEPGAVPAQTLLGASYLQLKQPAMAVGPLQTAVSIQPDMQEAQQMLAQALSALGRHEEALEYFRKWTEMAPPDPRAWDGLGRTYEALARRAFEDLEKAAPESGHMLALVGWVQALSGNHRSAFTLYREALERQPELRWIHSSIAALYRETGHPDWAAQEEAKHPEANCKAHPLECEFRAGKHHAVVSAAKGHNDAESLHWLARAYDELGGQVFSRLDQLPPSAERHALQARMHRDRGRLGDSIEHWRLALKTDPNNLALEKELATTLHMNRDYGAARSLVEKLLQSAPDSAELNYLLGHVLLNSSEPEKAIPYLAKACRLEPDFLPARSALGLAYVQAGKPAYAIPHLDAARAIDSDGSLHFRLAQAYRGSGQMELAKKTLAEYERLRESFQAQQKASMEEMQITPP